MKTDRLSLAVLVAAGAAGSASAAVTDINGMNLITRNFNDYPSSVGRYYHNADPGTLFAPGNNGHIAIGTLPGDHHVDEMLPFTDFGNFANRHLAFFSADNGATSYSFDYTQGFCAAARITVKTKNVAWQIATRSVEAGFWAHVPRQDDNSGAPYTDEGGTFIATNGTTFLGGAGLPFAIFGEGGWNNPNLGPFFTGVPDGNGYTVGAMDLRLEYFPPSMGSDAHVRFTATDVNSGVAKDTGYLVWGNSVDQFGDNSGWWNPGTQFGFRFQNAPQNYDFDTEVNHTISGIKIIPAPGMAGLIGLVGLAGLRRRR